MPHTRLQNSETELDNLFKKITKLCGADVVVTVCKPPSYISCFFQHYYPDIIIVHRRNSGGDMTFEDNSMYEPNVDDGVSLDVTGNPLEHPFNDVSILNDTSCSDINYVKVTVMPPGLDMVNARTACSLYNMMMPDNSLPLWAVCDGSESIDGGAVRLMCSVKHDGYVVEGWALDTGSKDIEPDPKAFVSSHGKHCKDKNPPACKISSRRKISKNTPGYYSSHLALSWTQLVFHPPTSSKSLSISMTTECKTGSGEGALRFIWEQLLLINTFLKCFESDGLSSVHKLPVSEGIISQLPNNEATPACRLFEILQEPMRQTKNPSETKFLINFISEISSPTYRDLDVLGKLWFLFLECSTLQELKRCLELLQEEIRSKHLGTHLYQIISATSLSQVTDLVSPLKHLIEFGVLKLHKEVTLILSKSQLKFNITTLPKFARIPMSAWRKTVDTSLKWLAHSFCLLELVCNTQEALNVRNEDLHSLANDFHVQLSRTGNETKDIDWYINNPVQQNTIKLLPQHVEKNVEGLPDEWLMEVKSSKSPNYIVESKFFNGTARPFVLSEHDPVASTTLGNVSMNNTTFNLAGGGDVILWSAQLHLFQHKFGKVIPLKM